MKLSVNKENSLIGEKNLIIKEHEFQYIRITEELRSVNLQFDSFKLDHENWKKQIIKEDEMLRS